MSEIALVNGSYEAVFFVAPIMIAYRGRVYLLVETSRHGLKLEASVDRDRENILTLFTAQMDTQPQ